MRVRIAIVAATLAALAACAATATATTAATGVRHEPAAGPDPQTAVWTEWPHKVICFDGLPFDPVAAFSGPTGAERGQSASARALRRTLAGGELPGTRQHGWRLLSETDHVAEFAAGPLFDEPYPGSTSELEWVQLRRGGDRWELEAFTSECTPQSVRRGVPATPWSLVPGQHLNADTRRVRVSLQPTECAANGIVNARLRKQEVREQNGALLLTIWLPPAERKARHCVPRLAPPLVITLPEKLGDRELFDGGLYPPRRAVRPLTS